MSDEDVVDRVDRNIELRAFILRLLDPEDLGHAVSAEVRVEACKVLRIPIAPAP